MCHCLQPGERFERAEQDASGAAFTLAGDIQAIVISVNEIDVGVPRWTEQDGVAQGLAAVGMGCGVFVAEVGFDFDDAGSETRCSFADKDFSENIAGDAARPAGEESAGKWTNIGRGIGHVGEILNCRCYTTTGLKPTVMQSGRFSTVLHGPGTGRG